MNLKNLAMWGVIVFLTIGLYNMFKNPQSNVRGGNQIIFSEFLTSVENGEVLKVEIQGNNIKGVFSNGNAFSTYSPNDPNLIEKLSDKGVSISASPLEEKMPSLFGVLLSWFPMLLLIAVWIFFMRQMQGGKGGAMGFGKSKAKMMNELKGKVTFNDVAGVEEAKEEVEEIVEFLKDPKKFSRLGGKIPRGALLVGPPGTGKTLLARAIAGEAGVPFFTISGSDFVEMFVGVGASRVRDMFEQGKKNSPCIIFIDEIDAVGRSRGAGLGGGNDEREQTLNQLLVEMDGFDMNENIMVFAATNLLKKLDPALTRSGRFDKKIYFDPPNFKERKELFQLYLADIKLPNYLTFENLSERGAGLTGADIANICNQAKINAIQGNQEMLTLREEDLQEAIDEIMIGREKRERTMSTEERERVSYHEAGHALMGFILENCSQPVKVSIIPRGEAALGFSQQKNDSRKLYQEGDILSKIGVLLGGRAAEKIIYGNVSTGAADDIEKASSLIYNYNCTWGMNNDIGPLNPDHMGVIGRNLGDTLFDSCQNIMISIERIVIDTLEKNKKYIELISQQLLKYETISYYTIKEILPQNLENSLVIHI